MINALRTAASVVHLLCVRDRRARYGVGMRLIKYTHACVRLENDGRSLLIDPGIWTEPAAYDGVSDLLITHEHFDHVDVEKLVALVAERPELTVHTHPSVAAQLAEAGHASPAGKGLADAVVTVTAGDTFTVNGFAVEAVGGAHAEIYEGLPGVSNVGFIVDGIYHPGDALHVPSSPVSVLLVPTCAPWLKLAEALDFVRAVGPTRAFSIHDAMLSETGEQIVDRWLSMKGDTDYARIPIGSSVEL
jgi:L-ascorbate metabolism protein UlaG (beta-lactamase superfamily)